MSLRLLHRRLAVLMGLAGLLAFAGGAGFEPVSTILAGTVLVAALFWHPSSEFSSRMEHVWVPLAGILVVRALFHVFFVGDDVVIPVVDLLLLLLSAEALRSLDAYNDARLYALSFALLLASAAYRPGILFAIAFLAYVVLGTVALLVGHLRRESERHTGEEAAISRRFLFGTAGLSVVTLLVSAAVFLTFPRVSRTWAGRGDVEASSIAGFGDEVSLDAYGAQIYSNPRVVLRVEFPDGAPSDVGGLHWRGRSYDHFDGVRWSRSSRLSPSLAPSAWYEERWGRERTTQQIYAAPLDQRVLFALHPVLDVDAHSQIHPLFDQAGDFTYWGSAQPVYTAVSASSRPTPEELRGADGRFTPGRGFYTQVPELPERIHALSDSLTAGLETRYDRVVAVRDWFHREFGYTLELPATRDRAGLDPFLFERREGHCEYFSTAMAILLRMQGIPTRNVNGFLGGQWSDVGDYLVVTQNEAHSWVEVWFPEYGWVTFDPTPGGGSAAEGAQVSFWPGRFVLDALQHRWSKWVLDYDVDTQFNILENAAGIFSGPDGRGDDGADGGGGSLPWTLAGLLAASAAGAVLFFLRMKDRPPPATRLYLRLRERASRAGLRDADDLPPLALARRLGERWPGAAAPVGELVDLYLRTRFAGEELSDARKRRMEESLGRARSALSGAADGASGDASEDELKGTGFHG